MNCETGFDERAPILDFACFGANTNLFARTPRGCRKTMRNETLEWPPATEPLLMAMFPAARPSRFAMTSGTDVAGEEAVDVVRTTEAAEILGVSAQRVVQIAKRLNAVKVGKTLVFPRKTVELAGHDNERGDDDSDAYK